MMKTRLFKTSKVKKEADGHGIQRRCSLRSSSKSLKHNILNSPNEELVKTLLENGVQMSFEVVLEVIKKINPSLHKMRKIICEYIPNMDFETNKLIPHSVDLMSEIVLMSVLT